MTTDSGGSWEPPKDEREDLKGWATGRYTCKCYLCGGMFLGAKRATTCAPCAYVGKGGARPCDHPGCKSHVSHPCEGCGRQWG